MKSMDYMKYRHFNNGIKAAFHALAFGNTVSEPVKVTIRLEKSYRCFQYEFLQDIVCFYDVRTQKAWMDEEAISSSVMKNYEIKDSLCAFVKLQMDAVFSDTIESQNHLVEILCMGEGVVLGEHAMFHKSSQYGLYYQSGHYELEIPKNGWSMSKDERKIFNQRISSSVLQTELVHWLYSIVVKSPSRLNELYMVKREPGKRQGTNVVRECQRSLEAALAKAEEYAGIVNAYCNPN